jgi:hypothetical protein
MIDFFAGLIPERNEKSGVAIVRQYGIGDALLFKLLLPLYAEALNVKPEEIVLWGAVAWKPVAFLFKDNPVVWIDEKKFARNPFYRLKTIVKFRRAGYKTALTGMGFRLAHMVDVLIANSGATSKIVVMPREGLKYPLLFNHYFKKMTQIVQVPDLDPEVRRQTTPVRVHELIHQLMFISGFSGQSLSSLIERLKGQSLALAYPQIQLPQGQEPHRYVVMNFGASYGYRCWPIERFWILTERLLDKGYGVVFLGGPAELSQQDSLLAKALELNAKKMNGPLVSVAINLWNFEQVGTFLRDAALVVSCETGMAHLSALIGQKTVCIMGGGQDGSFVPYPKELGFDQARFAFEWMPCFQCNWACDKISRKVQGEIFPCIDKVSVENVWGHMTDLLPELKE